MIGRVTKKLYSVLEQVAEKELEKDPLIMMREDDMMTERLLFDGQDEEMKIETFENIITEENMP